MSDDEAQDLAKRVINTWRLTPTLREWIDVLGPLDYPDALVTFQRLRADVDGALSIARFVREYRDVQSARRRARDDAQPPPRCTLCAGNGWINVPAERAHNPTTCRAEPGSAKCYCTAVAPCRCSTGQRLRPIYASIVNHNDRQLDAIHHEPTRVSAVPTTTPMAPSLLEDF